MSVVAGVAKAAAGAKVLTGMRPARERALPRTKRALVVMAVALLALVAFTALIPASQAPSAEHSSAASTDSRSGAAGAAPVSEPGAPQMSEREALDAYGKLPLSFVPSEGQTDDEAVRYSAQGAGYGFFFTQERATLSFANGKGRGAVTRWPSTS